MINRHDFGLRLLRWLLTLFSYGWLMLITCENPVRDQAWTGCGLREYVGRLVVVAQHVVQLEAVELALQISYDLTVRHHLWVNTFLVLHDLSHDQLRVAPDLETLDPEFDSDPEAVNQGFILGGVV
jgi:hypothetical protein